MAARQFKGLWRAAAVAALAVGAVACGGGDESAGAGAGAGEEAGAAAGTEMVSIEQFEFRPPEIRVVAGTTVTWTNEDEVAHTVQDDGGLFPESPDIATGETFSFTYDDPGTYPYICGIHPSMKGTVTVS
jgi:plastocyanin